MAMVRAVARRKRGMLTARLMMRARCEGPGLGDGVEGVGGATVATETKVTVETAPLLPVVRVWVVMVEVEEWSCEVLLFDVVGVGSALLCGVLLCNVLLCGVLLGDVLEPELVTGKVLLLVVEGCVDVDGEFEVDGELTDVGVSVVAGEFAVPAVRC